VTQPAVIDLDRPQPAPVAAHRPRILSLAVVAAVALTLGAAAAPAPPTVTAVLTVTEPSYDTLLAPPYLYTATGDTVTARPLVPGVRGWTVAVPGGRESPLNLAAAGGALIAGPAVLDPATGAVRLTAGGPGYRLTVGDGIAAIVSTGGAADQLAVHDLRTGRRLWSRTGPPVPPVQLDGAGHLITVDPDGHAVTRAVRDGRVLAAADLGGGRPVWDSIDPANYADAVLAGGRLYVRGAEDGTSYLAAYDAVTLTRRWRTTVPGPGRLLDCGPDVCVGTDRFLAAWRVTDGSFQWRGPGWGLASSRAGGRLLVADFQESRTAVLDAATGRDDRQVDGGVIRGDLILRPDRADVGHTWVLDLASGQALGRIAGVLPPTCDAQGDYLACPAGTDAMRVWRVRAASPGAARPPA
jgi:outer membrane protein assembly factor BamB